MGNVDGYISMDAFGQDHWSLLAYVETVMEAHQYFEIGWDGRMRLNRRHYRVLLEGCPNPKRSKSLHNPGCTWDSKYRTRLKSGQADEMNHDDLMCLQDLGACGVFTVGVEDMDVGVKLKFSDYGYKLAYAIRRHKANGGRFVDFDPALANCTP